MDNTILVGIFIVVFIIGMLFTYMATKSSIQQQQINATTTTTTIPSNTTELSAEAVGIKATAYLNKYFSQQGLKTTLAGIKKEGNDYHLRLLIGNKTYDSYASADGRFLFPSALDMDAVPVVG
jgi:hypothetical protein